MLSTTCTVHSPHIYLIRFFLSGYQSHLHHLHSAQSTHLSYQVLLEWLSITSSPPAQYTVHTFILSGSSWLCSAISSAPPAYIFLIRYFLTLFSNPVRFTCIHLFYPVLPDCVQQPHQHHLHTFIYQVLPDCVQQSHKHYLNTFISSGTSLSVSTNPISTTCTHYLIRHFLTVFSTTFTLFSYQVLPWACPPILSACTLCTLHNLHRYHYIS